MDDPCLLSYNASELAIAGEFLSNWIPFLTAGLCPPCAAHIRRRVYSLPNNATDDDSTVGCCSLPPPPNPVAEAAVVSSRHEASCQPGEPETETDITASGWEMPPGSPFAPETEIVASRWELPPETSSVKTPSIRTDMEQYQGPVREATADKLVNQHNEKPIYLLKRCSSGEPSPAKMSWADMAQEDEPVELSLDDEKPAPRETRAAITLTREQKEMIRFRGVGRKKDFICLERVKGKLVNILAGLELHTAVFSAAEQRRIVAHVYDLQEKGQKGKLGEHTYSEPRKWMRGKGRVTIQFGCCYNYATDKDGNPPGILHSVMSDPLPQLFKTMIKRMVRWHVLPTTCVPDSCIVNIYEPGDCIPPHIDSHDFIRPFCTVSFLSECNILFGSNLKIAAPGEFIGSVAMPLPVGSVLVMNGNGADVAKHCVPAVQSKRISITFRRMDEAKRPDCYFEEPDLQDIIPLYDGHKAEESSDKAIGKHQAVSKKSEGQSSTVGRSRKNSAAVSSNQSNLSNCFSASTGILPLPSQRSLQIAITDIAESSQMSSRDGGPPVIENSSFRGSGNSHGRGSVKHSVGRSQSPQITGGLL